MCPCSSRFAKCIAGTGFVGERGSECSGWAHEGGSDRARMRAVVEVEDGAVEAREKSQAGRRRDAARQAVLLAGACLEG